jgi:hypothetical protein
MALNSFLKIFMPKNKVFYELFEKVADKGQCPWTEALAGGWELC